MNKKESNKKIFISKNSFFPKSKKGQFYLIAAIIVIVIMIGFVTTSNYSKKKSITKLYDLKEELGIESGEVLDYGTYREEPEQMSELLKDFTQDYIDYAGEGRELYFVFGNYEGITVVTYQDLVEKTISLDIGEGDSPLLITKGTYVSEKFIPKENLVKIKINEVEFEFELKSGENFYFVIFQEIEGEKHIITG